jgi:hypothetical protein
MSVPSDTAGEKVAVSVPSDTVGGTVAVQAAAAQSPEAGKGASSAAAGQDSVEAAGRAEPAGAGTAATDTSTKRPVKKVPINTRRGWAMGKPAWAMGARGKGGCPCCAGPTHEETWRDEMGALANMKQ